MDGRANDPNGITNGQRDNNRRTGEDSDVSCAGQTRTTDFPGEEAVSHSQALVPLLGSQHLTVTMKRILRRNAEGDGMPMVCRE